MLFFALKGAELLGRRVAAAGGLALSPHEERDFALGEHKGRPLAEVRGHEVCVLAALQGGGGMSVNDRLMRLLFFIAACRSHGAARVTAIVPYLAYSRKDRQTQPQDPVASAYVARLFEAMAVDDVVTLDVHNLSAFQNAFRCRALHLSADRLFAADIAARAGARPLVVLSPDPGGVKRAQLLREALEEATGAGVGFAFLEKRRTAGVVSGHEFAGDVTGSCVHVFDDMICGGGTMLRAAEAARARGAAEVHALATHGLFDAGALPRLAAAGVFDSLTVTDSAAPFSAAAGAFGEGLRVIGCAPLIAGAIGLLHGGGAAALAAQPQQVPFDVAP